MAYGLLARRPRLFGPLGKWGGNAISIMWQRVLSGFAGLLLAVALGVGCGPVECRSVVGGFYLDGRLIDAGSGEPLAETVFEISIEGKDGSITGPETGITGERGDLLGVDQFGRFSPIQIVTDRADYCFPAILVLATVGGVLFADPPPGVLDPLPEPQAAVLTVLLDGSDEEIRVVLTDEMLGIGCKELTVKCSIELGEILLEP